MEKNKENGSIKKSIKDWIQVIGISFLIAFVLNNFIIANSRVPSASMEPTIMTGSRIIGSRLTYHFSDIERGDVVIFVFGWNCPACGAIAEGEKQDSCPFCNLAITEKVETVYYVKRVIGIPGDKVDMNHGLLYLNNSKEPLKELYLSEKMSENATHHFEVPENSYFMMGDNRNNSADSRYWKNPYIVKDKVIAKVIFEYFPQMKIVQ